MGSDGGVKKNALAQYGTNSATASRTLGQVSPIYASELSGNDGYTPQQTADAYTASAQSSGGGQAAAVGAGNLLAARDGNVGGITSAISDAARTAGDRNAQTALNIRNQSTDLAQKRQSQALSGLSMIYHDANDEANANLQTANQAQRPFWQQMLMGGVQAAGVAAPTIGKAFGL